MELITMYECEVCGQRYRDRDECLNCENSHITDLHIARANFLPKAHAADGFPFLLEIASAKTGEKVQYKRVTEE